MQITYRQTTNFLATLALICFATVSVKADEFSFTGVFTQDDEVQLFNFTVNAPSLVTLQTLSASGGTNVAGRVIPGGGFDPVLSLFNNSGLLINNNDNRNATTRDAFLSLLLQPGRYTLGLTQYDNLAAGPFLSNGFLRIGDPTFTREFAPVGATNLFYDENGVQRNGNFALDIRNVAEATPVPEPATLLLLSIGLAAGIAVRLNRRPS